MIVVNIFKWGSVKVKNLGEILIIVGKRNIGMLFVNEVLVINEIIGKINIGILLNLVGMVLII